MGERDRDRMDEGVGDRDRLPAWSLDPERKDCQNMEMKVLCVGLCFGWALLLLEADQG